MKTYCCGRSVSHSFYQIGCVECGAACCLTCALILESVTYCVRCAESILEVPVESRPGNDPNLVGSYL